MSFDMACYIAAFVLFLLAGFNVPRANWFALGFAALVLSLIF
jgi:hypothetical protein